MQESKNQLVFKNKIREKSIRYEPVGEYYDNYYPSRPDYRMVERNYGGGNYVPSLGPMPYAQYLPPTPTPPYYPPYYHPNPATPSSLHEPYLPSFPPYTRPPPPPSHPHTHPHPALGSDSFCTELNSRHSQPEPARAPDSKL